MRFCARCDNCCFVCETHPDKPWDGPRACGCGAPGDPCPASNNQLDENTEPGLPENSRSRSGGRFRDYD